MGGAEERSGKQNIRQKSLKIIKDMSKLPFVTWYMIKCIKNYNVFKKNQTSHAKYLSIPVFPPKNRHEGESKPLHKMLDYGETEVPCFR